MFLFSPLLKKWTFYFLVFLWLFFLLLSWLHLHGKSHSFKLWPNQGQVLGITNLPCQSVKFCTRNVPIFWKQTTKSCRLDRKMSFIIANTMPLLILPLFYAKTFFFESNRMTNCCQMAQLKHKTWQKNLQLDKAKKQKIDYCQDFFCYYRGGGEASCFFYTNIHPIQGSKAT